MTVNLAATFVQKMSSVWAYFKTLPWHLRLRDGPSQERHATCVVEKAKSVVRTLTTPRLSSDICIKHHMMFYTRVDLPDMGSSNVAGFGG